MNTDTLAILQTTWRSFAGLELPMVLALLAFSVGRWVPVRIRGQV
jgi:hypothetical protein